MPHCTRCGNELLEFAQFCPVCGQPAPQPAVAAPASGRSTSSLPLGKYFKTGWRLFLSYPSGFVVFFLAFTGTNFLLKHIPFIGPLASWVLAGPVYMGFFIVSAKLLQKHTPRFNDFFLGFRFFVPVLLIELALMLAVMIFSLAAGLLAAFIWSFMGKSTAINVAPLLAVLGIIYLVARYIFAFPLAVDRRLNWWASLKLSHNTVYFRWLRMFGFILLLWLLNLAGNAALRLIILVTMPLTCCTITAAYADLFGLESDYAENFPDNVVAEPSKPGE